MSDPAELKSVLDPLFQVQKFAVLCTFFNGQPYSNLVAFASTNNLKQILFTTNRNTRKYNNILGNTQVAILIDNRKNEPSDFSNAFAVTAIGVAQEITGDEQKLLSKIYLAKHPSLMGFLSNPGSVLVGIAVTEYIIAGFDKSQRFLII
jgi:nitroimidazol reductase NimA-like FMN-containing flavoprotein (pyridoxamine 5'-phosphate oxidase superfamily)